MCPFGSIGSQSECPPSNRHLPEGPPGLIRTVKAWQKATISKNASRSRPSGLVPRGDPADGEARKMRARGAKVHCGAMMRAGWSDAALAGQTRGGRCQLGYAIGLAPRTQRGSRRCIHWSSKFAGRLATITFGVEVYAFGEMLGDKASLLEFYGPIVDLSRGMAGFEDCETLFSRPKGNWAIAEKYSAWRLLGMQRAVGNGALGNVYWLPGPSPKSDMAPLLRLPQAGS